MLGSRRGLQPGAVAALGVVSIAAYLLAPTDSLLQVGLWFVPVGVAVVLVAVRWRSSAPHESRPLAWLLAGTTVYLIASLGWYITPVVLDVPLPFPSLVDAAYFTSYLLYAGFLLLVVRRHRDDDPVESRLAAVDALILTAAATTGVWEYVIAPNLSAGAADLASLTALAYPLFTLTLVGLALRILTSAHAWRGPAGALLVLWIGFEVAADLEYGHQSVNGTFAYGGLFATTWMASYVALGVLMVHPGLATLFRGAPQGSDAPGLARSSAVRSARLFLLYAAALVPVVVLGDRESFALVLVATMTTFGLVVLRLAIVAGDRREQQRLARELERANAAKSDFLATMSHEIRTPLNAVIGMTGLLLDSSLTSDQRDYAETTRGAGEALLAVINDILDFSKIEAGRLDLEAQSFLLSDCVESAVDLLAPRAAEKRIHLAYLVEHDSPRAVVGDITRLRQVLVNLLGNAVKFTDEGDVTLRVAPVPGDPGVLRFSVIDSGPGIAEETIERLFEPFLQENSSTTRTHGGTGLGLAISRRLVHAMGGEITVSSRLGEGSTFHVTVPLPTTETPTPAARPTPDGLRGKHVLVVDDNPTNRQILCYQLDSWGVTAVDTDDPDQALAWVRQSDPAFDACLLDLHMPVTDGISLARLLRESGTTPPLLLLSSLGERLPAESRSLFASVLTKPIKPSALFDALASTLAAPAGAAADGVPATAHPVSELRILLAEDNLVNQKVAVRVLERLGYRVDVVANGSEAVAAVTQRPYDVVLMDMQMPVMDGLEATRTIRSGAPADGQPWIVAMTANAFAEDRDACLAAGMEDYLSKPVRSEALAAALLATGGSNGQPDPGGRRGR